MKNQATAQKAQTAQKSQTTAPQTTSPQVTKPQMRVCVVGHVDHGKSTIVGRLLADTDSLPQGKLEQIKKFCEQNSRPFEYAFLLDALKDEQAQGITIDSARVFFKSDQRDYIIIDAPGHIEFVKNMVSGAARADAALLVIDAKEGIRENSKRHGYLLSMLGIKQILVLVNKMDLVQYNAKEFERLKNEYTAFLKDIGVTPFGFIPVSGFHGDNIVSQSGHMPWYTGKCVVDTLDTFENPPSPANKPFRMPVQDIYKFTAQGDDRRIVAGTIQSGKVSVGDEIVFYPSGKKSSVKSIEAFNAPHKNTASAGQATGLTLNDQIYITRGEVACLKKEKAPQVTTHVRVSLFWLGKEPLTKKKDYVLKIGTSKVPVRLTEIQRVIDASKLQSFKKEQIDRHEVAECILKVDKHVAFDLGSEIEATSRFVLVDDYEISGGGTILEGIRDEQAWIREKVQLRNSKWESSTIPPEKRAERYNQKASLILVTGNKQTDRKAVGKELEEKLFNSGKFVYMLSMGNVLYGVDADIRGDASQTQEQFRRLAEVAHIMLDAGLMLIVTAADVTQTDLEILKTTIGSRRLEVVWMGEEQSTDAAVDLRLGTQDPSEAANEIMRLLADRGIIFRAW